MGVVGVDVGDGPSGAVADHLAVVGAELAFVVAGGDLVAHVQGRVADPERAAGRVEFAGAEAEGLGSSVEALDGLVGGGHEEDVVAGLAVSPPLRHGFAFDAIGGAAVEAALDLVGVNDGVVTAAELEAGVSFPGMAEAVNTVEFDGAEGFGEEPEHATPPDGGELQRVTDQHHPPSLHISEVGELGQLGGGDHAGLVDLCRCRHKSTITVAPTGRS